MTSGAVIAGELDEVWAAIFCVVTGGIVVSLVRHVMLYHSSSGKKGREGGREEGKVVFLIHIHFP